MPSGFGVTNLHAVLGRAPDAWAGIPDPDAVYVGGSGRDVAMLVEEAWKRLKSGGRLVTACNSIENLAAVHSLLRARLCRHGPLARDDRAWDRAARSDPV